MEMSRSSNASEFEAESSEPELSSDLEEEPEEEQDPSASSSKTPCFCEDHWQIVSDNKIVQGAVWYEDGNVIVQAETTQFKVFQGVLTAHSPVFASILEDTEVEEVDGCRIIRTDDSAQDMKYFLEAFHSITLPEGLTELGQITAFLRLGTRYQVPIVQRLAIKTLLTSYPSSYHTWTKRQGHRTFVPSEAASFEVLNLCREFNVTQILPTVLYQCSRFCRYQSIMQGYNGRKIKDPLDIQRCVIAKANFAQALRRAFAFLGDEQPLKGCSTPEQCLLERYRMLKDIYAQDTSPLGVQLSWNGSDACRVCHQYAKSMIRAGKQKYWDGLSQLYGLNE